MDYYEMVRKAAVQVLQLVDPQKPYGKELFDALARVTVSVTVEAVCMRRNASTSVLEVLMTRRSPDEAYAHEWHCPGSVIRPGEEIEDVFNRLGKEEFGAEIISKEFIGNYNNVKEVRGHFFGVIYFCTVKGNSKGSWYPVDKLPPDTVIQHRDLVIPMVAEKIAAQLK